MALFLCVDECRLFYQFTTNCLLFISVIGDLHLFLYCLCNDCKEEEEDTNGKVPPSGDKCDVALEVLVDKRTASQLNSGADKLYDILVLHLEGGKDLFITINGELLN